MPGTIVADLGRQTTVVDKHLVELIDILLARRFRPEIEIIGVIAMIGAQDVRHLRLVHVAEWIAMRDVDVVGRGHPTAEVPSIVHLLVAMRMS